MTHADPVLAARRIPVIGGFVGATREGVTTTLGRGGSDYSAAIVGACLGVSEIQIWTDVDGMLTSDPRIVKDPHLVPHISFAEASELAYFGAKVLHPATIQPAVARNIPVRILNSQRANALGTLITAERPLTDRPLTAVAAKKGVTVVDITSSRMLMAHGFLSRLFAVFERFKTPVDVVTTSEVSVSVTVDDHAAAARRGDRALGLRRGVVRGRRWPLSASSATACSGIRRRGAGPDLGRRRAAADGFASGGAAEHHLRHPRTRRADGAQPPARHVLRALSCTGLRGWHPGLTSMPRLLVVGRGRMGALVESLAAGLRLRSGGHREVRQQRPGHRRRRLRRRGRRHRLHRRRGRAREPAARWPRAASTW